MAEFTKERLIKRAKFLRDRHKLALALHPDMNGTALDLHLAEISLAALTEQPVGYYRKATTGDGYYLSSTIEPRQGTIQLYRLPLLEGLK